MSHLASASWQLLNDMENIQRKGRPVSRFENVQADEFEQNVERQAGWLGALLIRKHRDYGPGNIAGAPGGPLNGIVVRLHDKMARLAHLHETGKAPSNESVRDTYADIANYAIIALMLIDGDWPGVDPVLDMSAERLVGVR